MMLPALAKLADSKDPAGAVLRPDFLRHECLAASEVSVEYPKGHHRMKIGYRQLEIGYKIGSR
jgi:hypothetical protein